MSQNDGYGWAFFTDVVEFSGKGVVILIILVILFFGGVHWYEKDLKQQRYENTVGYTGELQQWNEGLYFLF